MTELNPRIYAFIFLFAVILAFTYYAPSFVFPNKDKVKTNVSNVSNVTIIYKEKIVLVTPTPDGHTYFASEYQNGTRLLQRPFSWIRYNALGKMDMKVTTIVYDYRFFNKLHWFNPADYKYYEMLPENPNNKFLMIFVYVFMDNEIADDTRLWTFNRNFFAVYDGIETVRPIEYPYQLRFQELENTPTFDKSVNVQAFKSMREYSNSNELSDSAGEYNDEIYYLRAGRSNAIDGFLIFEVNKIDVPDNILVLGQFYAFGNAQWKLKA